MATHSTSTSNAQAVPTSTAPGQDIGVKNIPHLYIGIQCELHILVCRIWDATSRFGKYLSTDFLVSDNEGFIIQCSVKSNLSHRFVHKLQEGAIYSLRAFKVVPNTATFQVCKGNHFIIELESTTLLTRIEAPLAGFVRYPFQITAFDDIALNDNRFLIDVIGTVTNVGPIKPPKTGSQHMDCYLMNQEGTIMKATLWGALYNHLVTRRKATAPMYNIILTSMNVKEFRTEVYLSSTSATAIFDIEDIPQLAEFKKTMQAIDLEEAAKKQWTLSQLLEWVRSGKDRIAKRSVTSNCKVKINGLRPNKLWYYFSCSQNNCKKGVTRSGRSFLCYSCNQIIEYPKICYKVQLEVQDTTASTVVTLFDEVAEALTKTPAEKLLQQISDNDDEPTMPQDLQKLINKEVVLELKTYTYYNHGEFESFTCSNVVGFHEDDGANPSKRPREESAVADTKSANNQAAKILCHENGRNKIKS